MTAFRARPFPLEILTPALLRHQHLTLPRGINSPAIIHVLASPVDTTSYVVDIRFFFLWRISLMDICLDTIYPYRSP